MPYRLPPPWDPGFALPSNVKDEGLERRAFVTKQARRGTYDNPRVGTGGYVVPQYIQDEGYGQGAVTTAWTASGSTPGVRVPNYLNQRPQLIDSTAARRGGQAVTFARQAAPVGVPGAGVTLGDVPPGHPAVPAVYRRFGQRAATAMLQQSSKIAPSHRPAQFKAALDAIDRKLYPRAMKAARAAGGLHAGLSHAFATTLLEQVIETGKTGRRPRSGIMSLAGCGPCGSMSAMGAVPPVAAKITNPGILSSLMTSLIPGAVTGPGGIAPGTCDATGTMIWDAGGYWRRKLVGESCASTSNQTVSTTVHAAGGKAAPIIAPGTTKLITVGPFTFPLVDHMRIHWSGLLPDDWRAAINQQITKDCSPCIETSMRDASSGILATLRQFLGPEMPSKINHDFFGMRMGKGAKVPGDYYDPSMPIATTTRPDTGDDYALYAYVETRDPNKAWDANTNPYNLVIEWKPLDQSIWSWIWHVACEIVDWAGDAISAIGSLACDILTNPAGQVGAVAGGAYVGGAGGAKAGAAGAQMGAQMCAQPPAPQVVTGGGLGLPLAIVGVGIAAALLLTKKKRSAP